MSLSDTSSALLVENPYHKAKIEHYLERVGEFMSMARYQAAQKMLGSVFALDVDNKAGKALEKQIDENMAELRALALPEGASRNGHARQFRRGELVLVVDQDERILTSLADTLRKYGFAAVGAGSFEEAVDVLSTLQPNLIISEVNFESGSIGYDLYLWVRHNDKFSSTAFLYLATCVTREMLIAGKRMGVDEFIVKPLDEEVVMASILHCLSRRKKKVA